MKRLIVTAAAAALVAGCGGNNIANFQQQYDLAQSTGTRSDICAAARRAADDAMQRGSQAEFERWRLTRDIDCNLAGYNPQARPADERQPPASSGNVYSDATNEVAAAINQAEAAERDLNAAR